MSASSAQGRKRSAQITVIAVLIIAALCVIALLVTGGNDDTGSGTHAVTSSGTVKPTFRTSPKPTAPRSSAQKSASQKSTTQKRSTQSSKIPTHALGTLELIDAGQWPDAADAPGTRGGINFRNNEGLLPRTGSDGRRLRFQEWDVNPKKPGRSRDAERIITADDGSAWYTDDHYRSFTRIRGPN